jgi:exonuclease SbcD
MRLLHTSDLHLGKQLLGRSLEAAHDRFFDWLIAAVDAHAVDVVLIAGDIYEVAMPPSYARRQLYRFVDAAAQRGVTTVVVAGNHDSPATIGEAGCLLARANTLLVHEVASNPDDQVHVLPRRDGKPGAILCGVPFVRPRDVMTSVAGQTLEQRQHAFATGIADHYAHVYAAARTRRDAVDPRLPIVATGHLATVGTSRSEAMHEIYVGLLNAFPTDALPPADYVALGHIHRPMTMGERGQIRYCGAPIAVAFDELGHDKHVLLVDFENGTLARVEALPVPMFQPMRRVRGALDDMPGLLAALAAPHVPELPVWVEATIDIGGYVPDLMARLRAMAQGLAVDILRVHRIGGDAGDAGIQAPLRTLHEMRPREVFEQLLDGCSDLDDQRRDIICALFDRVANEVSAPTGDPS